MKGISATMQSTLKLLLIFEAEQITLKLFIMTVCSIKEKQQQHGCLCLFDTHTQT